MTEQSELLMPQLPPKRQFGGAVVTGKTVQCQMMWEMGGYKVLSISNTTIVKPGDRLDPKWVTSVCNECANWEVTMVDNDMAAKIFGFVRGLIPIP